MGIATLRLQNDSLLFTIPIRFHNTTADTIYLGCRPLAQSVKNAVWASWRVPLDPCEGTVVREVFSLRALVRPGNSGGPLVDKDGEVLGVIFAASVTDDETGYALTAEQVRESAARGKLSANRVDTGRCA